MSRPKKQNQPAYESDQSDQQPDKNTQKKLSQCRDYISMRSSFYHLKNLHKKKENRTQKRNLQETKNPQAEQQIVDDEEEIDLDRDGDPISLLSQYNKTNYLAYLNIMKQRVSNEKPYTEENEQLLQTMASKYWNICIYGFGSKIQYIRYLVKKYMGDHHIWQINGYKTSINDKKVYNNFGKFLKQVGVADKIEKITKEDQLREYRQLLQKYKENGGKSLVVICHCLDSLNFFNQQSQENLSFLFSLPCIKFICSIDNIKIAAIWHPRVKTRFNFRFFQINTAKPYIKQQMFRPNTTDIRQQADQATMNIYKSLNNNQKRILKLFAKQQLQNAHRDQPQYYTLQSLLDECIENIILSNDNQLRENLLELIDHRVIVQVQKNDQDRVRKYYTIKCNKGMLETIFKERIED